MVPCFSRFYASFSAPGADLPGTALSNFFCARFNRFQQLSQENLSKTTTSVRLHATLRNHAIETFRVNTDQCCREQVAKVDGLGHGL
jgi:hypothetical protein